VIHVTGRLVVELRIASLAERPELGEIFGEFADAWPEFMYHDPISVALLDPLLRAHPESNLVAVDPADPGRPVARACAVPYRRAPDSLPAGGYDDVILRGTAERGAPRGAVASALEITVRPDRQGLGLSRLMLETLCRRLADLGYTALVAPVRPNRKHLHPTEPMGRYLRRLRPDGLPDDPWLRVHVRAGASVVTARPRRTGRTENPAPRGSGPTRPGRSDAHDTRRMCRSRIGCSSGPSPRDGPRTAVTRG